MSLALHSNVIMGQSQINPLQPIRAVSSGDRVESNSKEAAQIGVTASLSTKATELSQKAENAGNSISMLQVHDNALSQIQEQMQKFRELTIQSSNSALNKQDQQALTTQKQSVLDTVSQIKEQSQFNGKPILKEGFQIDNERFPSIVEEANPLSVNSTLDEIDQSINSISTLQSQNGAVNNRVSSQIDQYTSSNITHKGTLSRITDADIAKEVSTLSQSNLREDLSIAVQPIKMNQNTALNLLMPR